MVGWYCPFLGPFVQDGWVVMVRSPFFKDRQIHHNCFVQDWLAVIADSPFVQDKFTMMA
jgi:hypothetical protein